MATLRITAQQLQRSIGAFGVSILILITATAVLPSASSAATAGPCDKFITVEWERNIGVISMCGMESTAIDSTDFLITSARDENIGGFYARGNGKIEYLPSNIGEKFPNILVLDAGSCPIKKVTKETFKGLNKLRHLWLYGNQIERIDDDTFDFIPAVEIISLGSKIKQLNARAFTSLSKLRELDLRNNDCINEAFGTAEMSEMYRLITSKCGFKLKDPSETAVLPSASSAATAGPCDKFITVEWERNIGVIRMCDMESTAIDSTDFLITSARDENIGGFYARGNGKIEYLPSNIGEKFPNILVLDAGSCPIKKVTKETFKGLNKLRHLWLYGNKIERIDDDTFEFIPAVEIISLGSKIKQLNARAFTSLSKLRDLDLRNNDCINEAFGTAEMSEMYRLITSKCGFKLKACGVSKKATPTIIRGENFVRGDFPWMVALHRNKKGKNRPEYICGASLISDRHVLTAAHCLDDLVVRDLTAVFGAYDLDNHFEVDRFAKSPSRMFVHDHWNPRTDQYDADIAMLLFPERIVFSTFVQPICLWESDEAPTASTGILPGWGQSQNTSNNHETIPTMLQLPIHTNEDCFLAHPDLARVSSKQTFCAGSADGRGPCFGDSGGGFYVQVGNVFILRGLVSAAWDVTIEGQCLLKKYTIYTDVLKFKEWIDTTMQTN